MPGPSHRGLMPVALALALLAACQVPSPTTPDAGRGSSPRASRPPASAPAPLQGAMSATPTPPGPAAPASPSPSGSPPAPGATAGPTARAPITLAGVVRLPAAFPTGGPPPVASRLLSDLGASVVSNNGGAIISNNGGAIISNNGGAVVSNNGGAVVGNNRAAYRLHATADERPLAGVRVRLLDASGAALQDVDGAPLTATTDAEGRYAFRAALPARALLVAADVPGGGELAAIAPRDRPADEARADVDLASTLTTGYIVNAYVAPQADRDAALGRLPAQAEADVRARARAALDAHATAAPDRLTRDAVVAAVADLRGRDAALNAGLADVRCLLLVAGDCALREGEVGTTVPVGVAGLVATPDGTLYVNDLNKNVVWRLDRDDRVRTAYRGGTAGPDADGLNLARAVAVDQRGRLLMLDLGGPAAAPHRLVRLEPEGPPSVLWSDAREPKAAFGGPGDEALVLTADGAFLAVAPGQAPREVHRVAAADRPMVAAATGLGGTDARGRLYLASRVAGRPAIVRLDPATLAFTTVATADPAASAPDAVVEVAVDVAGNVFTATRGRTLAVRRPDGAPATLAATLPAGLALSQDLGLALTNDGTAYLARVNGVLRARDGAVAPVVGVAPGTAAPGEADLKPYGLAVDLDGTLYVGEGIVLGDSTCHLYRYRPGQPRELLAGGGTGGLDGPASAMALGLVPVIRLGPGGAPYVLEEPEPGAGERILRLGPDGRMRAAYARPADARPRDFTVDAAGTLLVLEDVGAGPAYAGSRLARVAADGTRTIVLPTTALDPANVRLAPAPGGGLYLARVGQLLRWSEAGGLEVLATGQPWPGVTSLAVAPDGRFYVGRDARDVWRLDHPGATAAPVPVPPPKKPAILTAGGGPVFGPDGAMYLANMFAGEVLRVDPADLR